MLEVTVLYNIIYIYVLYNMLHYEVLEESEQWQQQIHADS